MRILLLPRVRDALRCLQLRIMRYALLTSRSRYQIRTVSLWRALIYAINSAPLFPPLLMPQRGRKPPRSTDYRQRQDRNLDAAFSALRAHGPAQEDEDAALAAAELSLNVDDEVEPDVPHDASDDNSADPPTMFPSAIRAMVAQLSAFDSCLSQAEQTMDVLHPFLVFAHASSSPCETSDLPALDPTARDNLDFLSLVAALDACKAQIGALDLHDKDLEAMRSRLLQRATDLEQRLLERKRAIWTDKQQRDQRAAEAPRVVDTSEFRSLRWLLD